MRQAGQSNKSSLTAARNVLYCRYGDRTEAVYETLRRELLMPHIDLMKTALGAACADMAVSLVVMSSESCTLLDRVPIDDALCSKFKELAASAGHHHGHYVPALKRLRKLLKDDAKRKVHPVVFFVSDGAPSDHIDAACKHGVNVWHPDPTARGVHRSGRPILQSCVSPQPCRQEVKKQTVTECCDIVRELGAMFDEDRITMNTIAFGDPNAQYEVLEQMARVLKRGSFQKLGLGIKRLRSALSTLSSTITTMLTSGGGSGLTLREPRPMETKESFHAPVTHVTDQDGWDVYTLHDRKFTLVSKQKYDCKTHTLVDAPLCDAVGVAFSNRPFAQGAERSASRCLEVVPDGRRFAAAGFPLVGKETLFREELKDARFHKRVARCHSEGNELAQRFNARIEKAFPGRAEFKLRYSECWIYTVRDPAYAGGTAWILAEPRLEGKWAKWNNNAGKIGTENASGPVGLCWHVPQAFSHFTYSMTDGKELFCDSQGIWNPTDGFCLTDPARHVLEDHRRHTRDRTDKGMAGMRAFFATHECSELCVQLGLQPFTDVAPLKL